MSLPPDHISVDVTTVFVSKPTHLPKAFSPPLAENQFLLALENYPSLFIIYDAKRRIVYRNSYARFISQITDEKILGKTDDEIPSAISASFISQLKEVYLKKKKINFETTLLLFNKPTTLEFEITPVNNKNGTIKTVYLTAHDITKYKIIPSNTTENFIKYAPGLVYEIDFRKARFTKVNDEGCKFIGYSEEELLKMSPFDLMDQESCQIFQERIKKLLQGKPVDDIIEYKIKSKSGQEYIIQLNVGFIYVNNIPEKALVIAHDITPRKKIEEKLQESEEKYKELVEYSNSIVMKTDNELNITYMNGFGLNFFGYKEEELIGKNVLGTTVPAKGEKDENLITMLEEIKINPTKYKNNVHQNMRKGGELVWVSWTNQPTYDSKGNLTGILAIGNDISKLKKVEEDLQSSEKKFRTIFENSPINTGLVDLKGNFLAVNRSAIKIHGIKSEKEIIGKNIIELVDSPFQKKLGKAWNMLLKKGKIQNLELVQINHKGEKFITLSSGALLTDSKGKPTNAIVMAQDITKRKQIENELQTIIDSARIMIFYKDKKNRFLRVNKSFAKAMGFSKKQLEGKSMTDFYPPAQAAAYFKDDQEVITTQKAKLNIIEPIQTKTGIIWSQTDKIPFYDTEGKIIGVIGFSTDITSQKKIEEDLRKSEQRFRNLAEHSLDTITRHDLQHRYIYVNPAVEKLFHLKAKDIIGKTHDDFAPPMLAKILHKHLDTVIHTQRPLTIEFMYPEGKYNQSSLVPEFYDGKLVSVLIQGRDITKLKELDKKKDEFVSAASHELKTPFTSIKILTQVLENKVNKNQDTEYLPIVNKIGQHIEKVTQLTNDLLDISKIRSGKLVFRMGNCDFNALVKDTITDLQLTLSYHTLSIKGSCNAKITGDSERLAQVIINLVNNAAKFSPHHTKIIIHLTENSDSITIGVQDFGIGIPKEHQKKVFERFYRVHQENESSYPGLGIGLYISAQIIKKHNGKIWVKSQKDQGSIFYFSLPKA